MALAHGKDTVFKLNAVDLSTYIKTSEITRESDESDVTCYGAESHVVRGGLLGGKCTFSGNYDTTATTGPRAALTPLIGTNVTLVRQPDGTGAGKAQDSVTVLVKSYTETNPVNEFVQFSVECTLAGDVTTTAQS